MLAEPSFDTAAVDYDDDFTNTSVGRLQRQRVYFWLEKWGFDNKQRKILEINGGTGVDAEILSSKGHSVIYTDISAGMVSQAKNRLSEIDIRQMDMISAVEVYSEQNCDTLFSNFGGLNCLSPKDMKQFVTRISTAQQTGQELEFVVMPRVCMIENLYFMITLRWSMMGRRKKTQYIPVGKGRVTTYYYSPKFLKGILKEHGYDQIDYRPVALFIPPSYLTNRIGSGKVVMFFERLFGRFRMFSGWSDHFIIKAIKQ